MRSLVYTLESCELFFLSARTFRVEDLYRKAKPILSSDIADDDVDVFCFSGAKVFLGFRFCLLRGYIIIVRPDLSQIQQVMAMVKIDKYALTFRRAFFASSWASCQGGLLIPEKSFDYLPQRHITALTKGACLQRTSVRLRDPRTQARQQRFRSC
jgi:hypothetical protein